jgi:hypothetical protein
MRLTKAIGILVKLRDGEPVVGRIASEECPCQSPAVLRALYTAIAALPEAEEGDDEAPAAPAPAKPRPSRAGKPWTDEEDTCLAAAFDEGRGVAELARLFDRSRSAIRLRLVKVGRLSAEDVMLGRTRKRPVAVEPLPAAAAG